MNDEFNSKRDENVIPGLQITLFQFVSFHCCVFDTHNSIAKFTTASPNAYPIVIQRLNCTARNKGEEELAVIQLHRDSAVLLILSVLFY
jgi:hypothetical protein